MSSDHHAVKKVKDLNEELMTGMICHCKLYDPVKTANDIGATILNTAWPFLSKEVVERMHHGGLIVYGGLTNDPEKWILMQEWGVDMVDTDTPDVLKKVTKVGN